MRSAMPRRGSFTSSELRTDTPSMVSQIKIKMSTLAEFCGLFLFWRRFSLNNSKNGKCPLCLVLIGSVVDKTQHSLRLVFRFVIRFQTSGQFQSNIICQTGLVHSISAVSMSILLKTMKKTTQVCGELVNEKRKNIR